MISCCIPPLLIFEAAGSGATFMRADGNDCARVAAIAPGMTHAFEQRDLSGFQGNFLIVQQ
jgi:hypothetical protein